MQMVDEKLTYDRECIHCQRYPECKGKPMSNKGNGCLKYLERSDSPDGDLQVNTYDVLDG